MDTLLPVNQSEIIYAFKAAGNANMAYHINIQAEKSLEKLDKTVLAIEKVNEYLGNIKEAVEAFTDALKNQSYQKLSISLAKIAESFKLFGSKFSVFLANIELIPREIIYATFYSQNTSIFEAYNARFRVIKGGINRLSESGKDITEQFRLGLDFVKEVNTKGAIDFDKLTQDIKYCCTHPNDIPNRIHLNMKDKELAAACVKAVQILVRFGENDKITPLNMQAHKLLNHPNWNPFPTESQRIEVVSLLLVDLINNSSDSEARKVIMDVFVEKIISKKGLNDISSDLIGHRIACIINHCQIDKCKIILEFFNVIRQEPQLSLNEIKQKFKLLIQDQDALLESKLPIQDQDDLLESIKTKKTSQELKLLFKKLLVSPFLFNDTNEKFVFDNIKFFSPDFNKDELFQKYNDSHWGVSIVKTEELIQLPKAFNRDDFWNKNFGFRLHPEKSVTDCSMQEDSTDKITSISSEMQQQAGAYIKVLEFLWTELEKVIVLNSKKFEKLEKKYAKILACQKAKQNKAGVERLKKAETYLRNGYSESILFTSCWSADITIRNKINQIYQISSDDDLKYFIFRGLDLKDLETIQRANLNIHNPSPYNQLAHFFPNFQKELNLQAWCYAYSIGHYDKIALLAVLFPVVNNLLTSNNQPPQRILQLPNENSLALKDQSKAISPSVSEHRAIVKINPSQAIFQVSTIDSSTTEETFEPEVKLDNQTKFSIIQMILKSFDKVSIITNKNFLLGRMTKETTKKVDGYLKELLNFWLFFFTTVNSDYSKQLPFSKKFIYFFKGSIYIEIAKKQLDIIEIGIAKVCAALSEDNILNADTLLTGLVDDISKIEKEHVMRKELHVALKKAEKGFITDIQNYILKTKQLEASPNSSNVIPQTQEEASAESENAINLEKEVIEPCVVNETKEASIRADRILKENEDLLKEIEKERKEKKQERKEKEQERKEKEEALVREKKERKEKEEALEKIEIQRKESEKLLAEIAHLKASSAKEEPTQQPVSTTGVHSSLFHVQGPSQESANEIAANPMETKYNHGS